MAKLQLPFELQKPDASTFVTQASEIGYNGKPAAEALDGFADANKGMVMSGNSNSMSIESKVNALIDCLSGLIECVVFHSGTFPITTPSELQNKLALIRYAVGSSGDTNTTAICGKAVCGVAVCGDN